MGRYNTNNTKNNSCVNSAEPSSICRRMHRLERVCMGEPCRRWLTSMCRHRLSIFGKVLWAKGIIAVSVGRRKTKQNKNFNVFVLMISPKSPRRRPSQDSSDAHVPGSGPFPGKLSSSSSSSQANISKEKRAISFGLLSRPVLVFDCDFRTIVNVPNFPLTCLPTCPGWPNAVKQADCFGGRCGLSFSAW